MQNRQLPMFEWYEWEDGTQGWRLGPWASAVHVTLCSAFLLSVLYVVSWAIGEVLR